MADSALYYPYIDVPETGALNAVLLYWDQLGAIVPRVVSPSSFTRELVAEGLVSPIAPRDYVSLYDGDFLEGFVDVLDRLPVQSAPLAPIFVHVDKGPSQLWAILDERGLVTRSPTDRRAWRGGSGWLCVEGRAGALYLAYLASWLSMLPEIAMEPITDQRQLFEAMGGAAAASLLRVDAARAGILEGVLPSPAGHLPARELASFKEQHANLLLLFRRKVEELVIDCAREHDDTLRRRLVDASGDDLKDAADEVRRRLSVFRSGGGLLRTVRSARCFRELVAQWPAWLLTNLRSRRAPG
jgi:hypothetical protein